MASVPSYALAGILKGRRKSSEAALKYAVYGAGAAGVMLYGISLLAGVLGSVHLPTMAVRLAELLGPASSQQGIGYTHMVLVLGGIMTFVGIAFKLSAVPFHFWCPDVFEGASAEVNAFLSVASKAAALALLVRVAMGFGYIPASTVALHGGRVFRRCRAADDRKRFRSDGRLAKGIVQSHCRRCRASANAAIRSDRADSGPLAGPRFSVAPVGLRVRHHGHVRQPGSLRPNQHQATAGLFDDRASRVHDHAGPGRDDPGRHESAGRQRRAERHGLLCRNLSVHEPGSFRGRGVPAQYLAQRGNRRLRRPDSPRARSLPFAFRSS